MRFVVVDTGYLLELFRVPGLHSAEGHQRVVEKFEQLIAHGGRIYVPVPVIFEFANHVAQVTNGHARLDLANKLGSSVKTSIEKQSPWIIIPSMGERILLDLTDTLALCNAFAAEFAVQAVGLTDISVITVARRIVAAANMQVPAAPVHIWTRDGLLKAHEPNAEPDAFV